MSTEGRPAGATYAVSDLESASFVRLVTRADGDALAASGLVARALTARGTPFQLTVGRTVAERTRRVETATEHVAGAHDLTVAVGAVDADVSRLDVDDRPATLAAVDLVRDLEATPDPDPILALAGLVAAGVDPGAGESEWILETARDRGLVERRPGVAVPTADPVDGLAHSTRLRAPWSGDRDATHEALKSVGVETPTELDADDHRAIGSLAALDVVGADETSDVAAKSIQRVLRPYATPDAPFETLGGYADVLEATARSEPGTGAALAMGHDAREPTCSVWREYGRTVHAGLDRASTGRYDGLFVVDIDDGPVEAAARTVVAYRSPEPVVLAVGNGEAAIATRGGGAVGPTVERIARELEGAFDGSAGGEPGATAVDDRPDEAGVEYDVGHHRGYLRYDPSVDESTIIAIVREVSRQ
ncbi:exonuclease [Natrarchaeobius halalkaliphilus]|uniref:Exonuclease n=1 Tax=Natrarchaeobius halalkaliphilus TaxID=1679091 RepID=A0A3N6LS98_9EURY|nr:exonuclease [Natrarchaeobius halalkaliphilus]RQG90134.1 exonuclease [Natrarchaeobius halalkaliphilus]